MKQPKRKTPIIPAPDPVVVWRILKYEADMFVALRRRRLAGPAETDLQYALIEAELIHIRVLCGFLLDRKTFDSDALLRHVMPLSVREKPLVDALKGLDGKIYF